MRASFVESLSRKVAQLRNRDFLEAAMAAAALVATADRDLRLSEQLALDELCERLERLRVYDPATAVEIHRRFVEAIERDPGAGRDRALAAVSHLRGREEEARLLLYLAATIARADADLSVLEQAALTRIAEALELPPGPSLAEIWKRSLARPSEGT